jgi:YfiH family protein
MIRTSTQDLSFFQFESLQERNLSQAVFTRHGGVSPVPWESLNIGGTVGDDPARVSENLHRIINVLGYSHDHLVQVRQIHSAKVILAEKPMDAIYQGDAIISKTPGLLMLMRFADCVPILFYDPVAGAAGIAHAGWQGTVKKVAKAVIESMVDHFGSIPLNVRVGIGPSVGPDHYYVGEDVVSRVQENFPNSWEAFLIEDSDGVKFDLWEANRHVLTTAGIKEIEISRICTACNTKDWYSHRAERGNTGRFGAVVGLRER